MAISVKSAKKLREARLGRATDASENDHVERNHLIWQALIPFVSSALGASAVAAAAYFSWISQEKDRDIQYLEYANKLLALPVKENGNIRLFAVNIIENKKPDGVKFTPEMRQEFLNFQMPLPLVVGSGGRDGSASRLYSRETAEGRTATTSAPLASKSSANDPQIVKYGIVTMPDDVVDMYVFYQERGGSKCERPANADPLDPRTFPSRLSEFIAEAKRKKYDLIITARSASRGWLAVNDIRIENISILLDQPYYCNGTRNLGGRLDI